MLTFVCFTNVISINAMSYGIKVTKQLPHKYCSVLTYIKLKKKGSPTIKSTEEIVMNCYVSPQIKIGVTEWINVTNAFHHKRSLFAMK